MLVKTPLSCGNLPVRIYIHREDLFVGFSSRYRLHRLVCVEQHDTALDAIKRFEATDFDMKKLRAQAEKFSNERFRKEMKAFADKALKSQH